MTNVQNFRSDPALRGGVVCVALCLLLVSCEKPRQELPATRTSSPQPREVLPLPIRLEKPRTLGAVQPAIVVVPERMAEPMVRVRLTEGMARPPVVDKTKYRGRIETVKLENGTYVAVNVVPMDAYLAGVLPKELYGSWGVETYRAQAVAARTFALFQMLTDGKNRQWDVVNDERSQVYGGIAGETAKSRAAVADTRGLVLMTSVRDGQGQMREGIFCSFFSACAGGATQDPFDAWGDPSVGPLSARMVGAVDEACPRYSWPTMSVNKSDITRCVRSWGERNEFEHLKGLGTVTSVVVAKRNAATGRPVELALTDVSGRVVPIRAEEFRLALMRDPMGTAPKPFSSNFEIRDLGPSIELFNGKGHGHGIGMSQWGAQALAAKGWTYGKILGFYYPSAKLKQLW